MVYGGGLENRLSDELSWVRIPPPPPVGKRSCWLALYEGSTANFRPKIEFFVFVLRSKPLKVDFSLFYFLCLILIYLLSLYMQAEPANAASILSNY